ncbi:MAG: flippase-like domain-containing protein [Vallitalea sp.]|jgi:uncharacterized protein (TIRG00374 family)|nr:flippase-like domain-containing protein [Vallitalea sp.]
MINKKLYYFINAIMLGLAFIWLFNNLPVFFDTLTSIEFKSIYYLVIAILLFLVVHTIKAIRMYLILLETKIPIIQLFKQYFKTTFVTILIPFKIGDFFRFVCFSKEVKSYKTGFIAVLIDRFFDTIVLLFLLMIYQYQTINNSNKLYITIIIITFLVMICIINVVLYITYPYLNHFLIIHGSSKKSLVALEYLEQIKNMQISILEMIKGRTSLIILLSFSVWGIEFLILKCVMILFNKTFDLIGFGKYLEYSFFGTSSQLNIFYFCLSSIIIIFVTIYLYFKSFIK